VALSWARFWYSWVSAAFLRAYIDTTRQVPLLSHTPDEMKVLLDAYLMEKLFHELEYNLTHRPDRVIVPLQGMLQVLEDQPPTV
jgi:maltose alpha-D-glucosyltransferase/alpha-amylase